MKTLPPLTHEFTIDEAKWIHGTLGHPSHAYSALKIDDDEDEHDGKMCCLGFLARSCKVKMMHITNVSSPDEIPIEYRTRKFTKLMFNDDGDPSTGDEPSLKEETQKMMSINDIEGLTLTQRKNKLTKLFRSQGIGVTFVNTATA